MSFYWLLLGVLCVWRITHLLNVEDGPWDLFFRFRKIVGNGFWGKLLDCFYCLSVWVALPFAIWLGSEWKESLLLVFAFSAGAILLERITCRPKASQYFEDKEVPNDVLRREEGAIPAGNERPAGERTT
jgi:hypothetical protein